MYQLRIFSFRVFESRRKPFRRLYTWKVMEFFFYFEISGIIFRRRFEEIFGLLSYVCTKKTQVIIFVIKPHCKGCHARPEKMLLVNLEEASWFKEISAYHWTRIRASALQFFCHWSTTMKTGIYSGELCAKQWVLPLGWVHQCTT